MKKMITRRRTNTGPPRPRRLELARDTVRALGHDELSRAVGGETGCDSTSNPTQTKQTNHR